MSENNGVQPDAFSEAIANAYTLIKWAFEDSMDENGKGQMIVSTSFGPYETVILHLCVRVDPRIPVLWVDHGYNRPVTRNHAMMVRQRLNIDLRIYRPPASAIARYATSDLPNMNDEEGLNRFSEELKLKPFRSAMAQLAPTIWITGLRRSQNPGRAGIEFISHDTENGVIKLNPIADWPDEYMSQYLRRFCLPNELDYFDPAKGDAKRECGLHNRQIQQE
jgi:phosphoadenosine phosphosulfate reductase